MKKYILILLVFACLFSCNEDELLKYESGNYLNFVQHSDRDSVELSFFFHPGQDVIRVPIELALTGNLLKEDKEFKLSIDESSTATADDFEFEEELVFKANKSLDTIYMNLKKTSKLSTDTCKLVLKIEENANFKKGVKEYLLRKIYFTSVVSKPEWWDDEITGTYLGEFSAAKYLLFCKVVKVNTLTGVEQSVIRQYALVFKRYLNANPSYDGDKLIEIPVIG